MSRPERWLDGNAAEIYERYRVPAEFGPLARLFLAHIQRRRTMTLSNGIKLVAALAFGLNALVVAGAEELPKGAVRVTPEELKWRPGQVPGVEIADVVGASTKPGPFVERIKFPANFTVHAHSHPDDRTYTVISGTWYVGYGDKLDPKKLKALPAGSFHTEPANVNHFTMTKEGGVLVQITGTAPTGFNYVDPAHAPKKK